MSGNLSLLTVLFIMCYFIKKGRNDVVYTEITRKSEGDYFKDVCKNCFKYGAEPSEGVCKCEAPRSLFLRSEKCCIREDIFMRKYSGGEFGCKLYHSMALCKEVFNVVKAAYKAI